MGGFDWWATPTSQRQVIYVESNGTAKLQADSTDGNFSHTLATGLPVVRPLFVEGGAETGGRPKKLFIFGPGLDTRVITGTALSTSVIGGTPLSPPVGQIIPELLPIGGGGGGGGNIDDGVHHYCATFLTPGGETTPGAHSAPMNVANKNSMGIARLFNIPFGPDNVIGRKVYRTKAGGTTFFLLATINNNTTTEMLDNTADADLATTEPPTLNTTNGRALEWSGSNWPTCGAIHERRLWAAGLPSDPLWAGNRCRRPCSSIRCCKASSISANSPISRWSITGRSVSCILASPPGRAW